MTFTYTGRNTRFRLNPEDKSWLSSAPGSGR